ncbi:MAG: rod-binding protein [Peptococcaceae bacterium]|jgi:flagellar protein FlgJ|nr:rod-binding protein [Peptococcaceae bacterium]
MDITGIGALDGVQSQARRELDKSAKAQESFQNALNQAMSAQDDEKLKMACQEFESYFLYKMIRQMRQTIPESDLIPKSYANKIYEDMLDDEMSKKFTGMGGIGLADMMYKQIKRENAYTAAMMPDGESRIP